MRDQDIISIQGRIRELALEQIQSQVLEILQLRATLEHERAESRVLLATLNGAEEEVYKVKDELAGMQEEIDEMEEALGAAQASVEAYERMERGEL